jgi:glycosyltransferase involved in cell wall biosynthesis
MRLLREEGDSPYALVSQPHPDGSSAYSIDGVLVQPYTSKLDPELWFPRADVVLSHLGCAIRSNLLGKKWSVPVGHLIHNDQSYCITSAERGATFLVFNTKWVQDAYAHIDVPGVVLHPIVDPERYTVETTRKYVTLSNLSDGSDSRMSYDKGSKTFYELARRNPDIEFMGVIGAYGTQDVRELPNVKIVDHQHSILNVYRETAVLLVPSKYESYGRSPVEAACSSIPSIVTGTQGLYEAMGADATFCDFEDFDGWDAALHHVLDNYEACQERSRVRALKNWTRTVREWADFYSLIKEVAANGSYHFRRLRDSSRVFAG